MKTWSIVLNITLILMVGILVWLNDSLETEVSSLSAINNQLVTEASFNRLNSETARLKLSQQEALIKEITENSFILTQIPGMTALVSGATQDAIDSLVGDPVSAAKKVNELLASELAKMPLRSPFALESGIQYTAYFGDDVLEGELRKHGGVDVIPYSGVLKEPIYATKGGEVVEIGHNSVYGKYLIIDHGNGYRTKYAHLSLIYYSANLYEVVEAGELIGLMGNTGMTRGVNGFHLHYEVQRYDINTNEWRLIDPEPLIEYGRRHKSSVY